MPDLQQTVTQKNAQGIDENGNAVAQTTKHIHTERSADPQLILTNLIWFIYGVIFVLLSACFILLLSGANSTNGFVSFVYSASKPLVAPFGSIFSTTNVDTGVAKSTFQPSILVAVVVYALVAWGVTKLININSRQQ